MKKKAEAVGNRHVEQKVTPQVAGTLEAQVTFGSESVVFNLGSVVE